MGTASQNAAEAFDMSWKIADLEKQLAEAKRDIERIAWAMHRASSSGAFDHALYPNIVRLEYADEDSTPRLSDWCLYTERPSSTPIEKYRIRLGNGTAPILTQGVRAIIDVAMARKPT